MTQRQMSESGSSSMETVKSDAKVYPFLEGGGEMGRLTRAFDWSRTAVGPVENWPQSLRTTVGTVLHSDFPMFLWWGDEMIQFYNDAYRPSLGDEGKHPLALGQDAATCWPEIWDVIYPLIQKVRLHGESFFLEDQLIPIFRNGKLEDVYWTFSYSPVMGDTGKIEGVLVICNETTRKVQAVAEMANARKALATSQRNLLNFFMQAPAIVAIMRGPEHVFELANPAYMRLVGADRKIIGLPVRQALPELEGTGFYELLDSVYASGRPLTGNEVSVMIDRNGDGKLEEVFLNFVYQPTFNTDGEMDGIFVHAVDISDQVAARKAIEESEERYKILIKESTVGVGLYYGRELRIRYVNEVLTQYWGKDISVVGKTIAEAVPELIGQPFLQLLDNVFTSGVAYKGTQEEAWLKVDGKLQPFYYDYTYKPLRNSEGEVYAIHHTAVDVTQEVLAKRRLEKAEDNLRNIILQAPVGMCIFKGPDHVLEIANERMYEIWGKEEADLINKPIFEALPEAAGQGFEQLLNGVYTTGQTCTAYGLPVSLPRDGRIELRYVNFVYEAFIEGDSKISGVMAVAIDVTEQILATRKIEEVVKERTIELAMLNENLKESNNELSQFAYIASHDLQEPARKIRTFSEMLERSLGDTIDARSKTYVRKIDSAAARMLTLIRDILSYSQIAKGEKQMSVVDLNDVLKRVTYDLEVLIAETEAEIVSDALPEITGIPIQIDQLFSNLISNSLKFRAKGRKPVIRLQSRALTHQEIKSNAAFNPALEYFCVSFADNGIGFSPANSKQIFEIFQRLHLKTEYEGTGIGLAICKKIVQNHGGEINADSVPGEGATFYVILPRLKGHR